MKKFNCRKPFIISVNGCSDQIASRIAVNIYDKEGTTSIGNYELSKTMQSDTQRINYYNISPICYDFINLSVSNNDNIWIKIEVLSFYTDSSNVEHILSDEYYYVSLGFTDDYGNTPDGLSDVNYDVLFRPNLFPTSSIPSFVEKINYSRSLDIPEIYFAVDTSVLECQLLYKKGSTTLYSEILPSTDNVEFYQKQMALSSSSFDDGNTFEIQFRDLGTSTWTSQYKFELTPICEIKYNPIELIFINKYGGLQSIFLFKNNNQSIEVAASNYNTNTFTTYPNYHISAGQTKVFNKNGKYIIKANTGWVDENINEFIEDIMLSEYLCLTYQDKGVYVQNAVILKDTNLQYKTHLNEKVINYELSFEVASKIINNVI